jgi:hypothetical protein
VNAPRGAFEPILTGGDRRSLGRVDEVIEAVLARPSSFAALFDCLFSADEIVRMRAGDAIEKVARRRPDLLEPYHERLLVDVAAIEQASVQWHLAQILPRLELGPSERRRAIVVLKRNLETYDDWIVTNLTLEALAASPPTTRPSVRSLSRLFADTPRASASPSPPGPASCSLGSGERHDKDRHVDRHRAEEPRMKGHQDERERDDRPDGRDCGAYPRSNEHEDPADREYDACGDRQRPRERALLAEHPRAAGVERSVLLERRQPDGEVHEPVGNEEQPGEDAHARSTSPRGQAAGAGAVLGRSIEGMWSAGAPRAGRRRPRAWGIRPGSPPLESSRREGAGDPEGERAGDQAPEVSGQDAERGARETGNGSRHKAEGEAESEQTRRDERAPEPRERAG